jgi:hypothetical protein
MPEATTTTPKPGSRKPTASVTPITDAKGATSTGRTTTGDNGGGHNLTNKGKKPEPAAKATPTPTPPVAKALGPSGYRQKHGTTDEAIVEAIRDDAKANEWELTLSDGELLAVIAWAYTPRSAIAKVRAILSA